MKKTLGIIIGLAGILIIACALILTPAHGYNLSDSNSSLKASAPIFFGGIIIFGAGVVILANALAEAKRVR